MSTAHHLRPWLALALLQALLALGASGQTAAPEAQRAADSAGLPLDVAVGMTTLLRLPDDGTRLAVADEVVAKVTVIDRREVLVHGLALGRTSLYAWLRDGRVLSYVVRVQRDLETLRAALRSAEERLSVEQSADGRQLVLRGEVDDAAVETVALERLRDYVALQPEPRPGIVNLMRSPQTRMSEADQRLAAALGAIDPRIRVRRVQVGPAAKPESDSYVLEGRVRTLSDLVRAVNLAERQLGGRGSHVAAKGGERRLSYQRTRQFQGSQSQTQGGSLDALGGQDSLPAGLASQVSRRMMITSESGGVLSFLEVDRVEEILVSIRVYEIDRGRARRLGLDYRVDAKRFSLLQFNRAEQSDLRAPVSPSDTPGQIGTANVIGSYVSDSLSLLSAVDALEQNAVARSVAEPNVLTLNGEEATVMVGGEVPIPTASSTQISTAQGYAFQSFGVRLDIRPTVDAENIVTLEVAPSIVRPNAGLGVPGVPGFEVQTVQTVARVKSGQSLILGGLINWEESVQQRKVPLVGDIPVLGWLFKWNKRERAEKELLFVMTPRVQEDALAGLKQPIRLPSPQVVNQVKLGRETTAAHLTENGLPSSWVVTNGVASEDTAAAASSAVGGSPLTATNLLLSPETNASHAGLSVTPPAETMVEPAAEAGLEAERQAKTDAEAKAQANGQTAEANLEAERQARAQAEAQVKAERQAKIDAEAKAQADRRVAEAKLEAERQARARVEAQVKAERQAKTDAEAKAQADSRTAEAKLEAERQARAQAESQVKAERQAKIDAEAKAQADRGVAEAKLETERQARERAEAQVKAERQAKPEASPGNVTDATFQPATEARGGETETDTVVLKEQETIHEERPIVLTGTDEGEISESEVYILSPADGPGVVSTLNGKTPRPITSSPDSIWDLLKRTFRKRQSNTP